MEELKEVFIRLDENGDGNLQLEEITSGLKEVLGHVKGSMKIFDEIMNSLDRNCNGVIDYTEFLTAAVDKNELLCDENLKFSFKMFDADQSGAISRQELKNFFENSEKKDDQLWNEIFREVDTDGDGEITFDEFKSAMLKCLSSSNAKKKYLVKNSMDDANYKQK